MAGDHSALPGDTESNSDAAQTVTQIVDALGAQEPLRTVRAIDFTLTELDGREVSLTDYRGKLLFLNFWATWCVPCKREMPAMEALYGELHAAGLAMLAVDLQEQRSQVFDFVADLGLTFDVAIDAHGAVARTYAARSLPTTYLIDARGFIIGRVIGARDWERPATVELFRELIRLSGVYE